MARPRKEILGSGLLPTGIRYRPEQGVVLVAVKQHKGDGNCGFVCD
jgi:hypothetical protein